MHAVWTDPVVRRYLFDDREITPDETGAFVQDSAENFRERGAGLWALRAASGEPAGPIGFCGFLWNGEPPEPELIYGLLPAFHGRGLATEAARAALTFAFETTGWPQVRAGVDAPNQASIRLLEKLGMRLDRRETGAGNELLYYILTADEWRGRVP